MTSSTIYTSRAGERVGGNAAAQSKLRVALGLRDAGHDIQD